MEEIQRIAGAMTPITVIVEGRTLTGIRTGISSRGFGAQQLAAVTMHGGMLVHGDRFTPWPVERLVEHGGELYLCGPLIEGARSISDAIEAEPTGTEELHRVLAGLLESASHALSHELSLCNPVTSAIGDDGSFLFLKRDLAERINADLPLEHRKDAHFPYRYDTLRGVEAETYQLAALAYRLLTGQPVCREIEMKKAALCHSAGAAKEPVHLHRPEVEPAVAALIDALLSGTGGRDIETLTELARLVGAAPERLVASDLGSEEIEHRRTIARAHFEKWSKSTQRRNFRRRYGTRIAIITGAVLLVATIPFGVVRRALTPPPTAGMAPREVVSTFYEAWNDLDHMLMEEIAARNVADDLIREVTNVYVVERVRTAYGDQGHLLSVDEWNAEGRPSDRLPYGIDELSITMVEQNEERARAIAEYRIWRPEGDEEGTRLERTTVRDEIVLAPGRYAWEIVEISRRVLERVIDPPIDRTGS